MWDFLSSWPISWNVMNVMKARSVIDIRYLSIILIVVVSGVVVCTFCSNVLPGMKAFGPRLK